MSGEHARIAPSSLARTVQCPASLTMQELYLEEEGPAAREGTAAHWAFSEPGEHCVGEIAPNGVVLDEEMIESADLMRDTIAEWGAPFIERRVSIPTVHAECWGTPDAYDITLTRLKLADLKHGHGHVEVFENWQLMAYAWGAMRAAGINGLEEWALRVDLTIVQPRSYHRDGPVRTWSTTGADLRAYRNIAHTAAHEALGPNPRASVGPECKHCTARHACATLQSASLDVVDVVGRAEPLDLPTAAAASEKRRIDRAINLARARSSGLESQLLSAARNGESVPGYRIEHGQGREKWVKGSREVFALGDLLGIELRKPIEPVTPVQARKLGLDVPGFAARSVGEAKLVLDSGQRAAQIFGGIDK